VSGGGALAEQGWRRHQARNGSTGRPYRPLGADHSPVLPPDGESLLGHHAQPRTQTWLPPAGAFLSGRSPPSRLRCWAPPDVALTGTRLECAHLPYSLAAHPSFCASPCASSMVLTSIFRLDSRQVVRAGTSSENRRELAGTLREIGLQRQAFFCALGGDSCRRSLQRTTPNPSAFLPPTKRDTPVF